MATKFRLQWKTKDGIVMSQDLEWADVKTDDEDYEAADENPKFFTIRNKVPDSYIQSLKEKK